MGRRRYIVTTKFDINDEVLIKGGITRISINPAGEILYDVTVSHFGGKAIKCFSEDMLIKSKEDDK